MTFKEIQEKLKKCELALTSIKDGSYSSTKYNSKEEAIEKLSTLKESLEKKLNLLKETTVIDPTTPPSDAASIAKETGKKIQTVQKAIDTAKKGKEAVNIAEDEYEAEDETISTSHISLISKEIHKALIDALQDTGHEVSEDRISSLNPQTFTIEVKFKDNTQSDYSFEVSNREVKIEGNIVVNTNKKGVSPVLNKEIAKDNLVKYIKNLSEELDPVGEEDDDINNDGNVDDTDKYLKKRRDAISKNIKEEETEFEVDSTGKPTGNLKLKLSDKDKETLKKIEALLAKEKNETKGAPKGHYFTKSGNLVKGRLTKDARERGARLSDPKDKQRSKVPPVTQYNEGEGDDHHYIKVPRREYKKAMSILDGASDGNFVKMDFVDDDGAGNVIIYFEFSDGYIASGQADAYMYDAVSDLQAQDVTIPDHSAELDEALDINDPALMAARVAKMRADDMKKLDAYKKSPEGRAAARAYASGQRKEEKARALVQKLKAKRAEIEREMENDPDIEPQGGPVADMYGDQLNKIDNAIEKAASVYNKPMDYDTAVGKVTEGNEEAITYFQQAIKLSHTNKVRNLILKAAKELGLEIPKVWTEDVDVGHVDDEPGMLKQDAYEIAQYSIQLFKLLKHYESLDVEVDFPNWWQRKVMLARDYISKATHYLDFKTNEPAIDSQAAALEEGRSANAIKKDFDELVDKMRKLAKHYKTAKGDAKEKIVTALKQHTDKKKALEKELDQAIQKKGSDQELDTSINELSGDQTDALYELRNILDEASALGDQARDIIRQSFPRMLSKGDAYGAFEFGTSGNRYDTTLSSIIDEIEEYYDEEEDDMDEGKYKSDAQRKAIYATKAEKAELKEEMDGGRLFDYLSTKYHVKDHFHSDNSYMVQRKSDSKDQYVIFDYNKDRDQFYIRQLGGYNIDDGEAGEAGMNGKGGSRIAGIESYYTDGNYSPEEISVDALKKIVDHVMGGHERYAKSFADFYKDRGRTSGTVDEKAPGFKHDCAAKVVHETYGVGICIPEKHTLIKEGSKYVVTHYDVLFKEGKKVVEDIPVKELQIVTQKEHWHKGYKKKKK